MDKVASDPEVDVSPPVVPVSLASIGEDDASSSDCRGCRCLWARCSPLFPTEPLVRRVTAGSASPPLATTTARSLSRPRLDSSSSSDDILPALVPPPAPTPPPSLVDIPGDGLSMIQAPGDRHLANK